MAALLAVIVCPALGMADAPVRAMYFYISYCESCAEGEAFIADFQRILAEEAPGAQVVFTEKNIASEAELMLYTRYCAYYGVPEEKRTTPMLFMGDRWLDLSGISTELPALAKRIAAGGMPATAELWAGGRDEHAQPEAGDGFGTLTWLSIAGYGLVAGFNPCALSMLLFMISFSLAGAKRVLPVGLAYLGGKAVMYLLLGTLLVGLTRAVPFARYQQATQLVLAAASFVLGALYGRDAWRSRREQYGRIKTQLPPSLRKWNMGWIKRIAGANLGIVAAFGLGLLISVGEFLCTGQILLATILATLQGSGEQSARAFGFLVLYTCAFLTPMLVAVLVLDKTKRLLTLSEWFRARMPLVKAVTALVFLVFGLVFLLR